MTSKQATHECAACGGTGFQSDAYIDPGAYRYAADYWDALECPVCLGSGRISDVMPVEDALADAETLRCSSWDHPIAFALIEAQAAADPDVWRSPSTAYLQARLVAAPAAFRAVPDLRG